MKTDKLIFIKRAAPEVLAPIIIYGADSTLLAVFVYAVLKGATPHPLSHSHSIDVIRALGCKSGGRRGRA